MQLEDGNSSVRLTVQVENNNKVVLYGSLNDECIVCHFTRAAGSSSQYRAHLAGKNNGHTVEVSWSC